MVECELVGAQGVSKKSLRFNRYMVECEFHCTCKYQVPVRVLIDTWWNVN